MKPSNGPVAPVCETVFLISVSQAYAYYNSNVDSRVARFSSREDAKKAEREYYPRLTPAQRQEIMLELIDRHRDKSDASSERLERVERIIRLSSS